MESENKKSSMCSPFGKESQTLCQKARTAGMSDTAENSAAMTEIALAKKKKCIARKHGRISSMDGEHSFTTLDPAFQTRQGYICGSTGVPCIQIIALSRMKERAWFAIKT